MFHTITKSIKWISLPALLVATMFSRYAAGYELLIDFVVCLGAIFFVQRAVWMKEYYWAAGFVAIAVVFSPFALAVKIFLLMGLVCVATSATLASAFRTKPLLAWHRAR